MVNAQFEEGQLVLCTVRDIFGTTVFIKIDETGNEGTITTSEIAPGRIRNLRDYVVPNKKIVCKILRIQGDKLQLSLRRVKPNERKEFLEKIEKEKSYKAILKTVLGSESEKLIEKITQDNTLAEFFENLEENKEFLEKNLNKEQFEKIMKILESKKEKPKKIKQIFRLSSKAPNGIVIVKDMLKESCNTNCQINYIAAGKYSIVSEGKDLKEIDNKISLSLKKIESLAKKNHCEFSVEKS